MTKRILTLLLMTFTGLLILFSPVFLTYGRAISTSPLAYEGELNAAAWDIDRSPIIKLDGEWEFYWDRLLTPENFENSTLVPDGYMKVPSLWNGKTIQGKKLPIFGCATYRLVLKNIPYMGTLALKKVNVRFSSRVFVNGQLFLSDGSPARTASEYHSSNTSQLGFFEYKGGNVEIIVQAANFEYINSGIPASFELGLEKPLMLEHQQNHLMALLVFGVLCTLALLHLIFFLVTRDGALRNPMLLLFALFCVLFALGNGLADQRSLLLLLPDIPFILVFKLKDFFLSACFIVLLWIFYRFKNGLLPLRLATIISLIYACYLVAIFALPIYTYLKIHGFVMAGNTVVLLGLLFRSVCVYIKEAEGFLLFAALVSINLYSADSILFSLGIKGSSSFLQVYILLFTVVMIGYLSVEYRSTVSRLSISMQQAQEAEISFLRAQIKPHFLYNSLSVIAAQTTQEPQKAKNLLYDLTDYLRGSFHFKTQDGKIPLSEEINTVRAYLSIEQARFDNLLMMEYDIEENLDAMVPLLCLQPIVENAVRHGIFKRAEGGRVLLRIRRKGDLVIIRVEDNGVGIPQVQLESIRHGNSGGVGLKNIQMRLGTHRGAGLEIESTEGEGTVVTLKIPYEEVCDEGYFSG
ncbi:signal transduction histidine kinase, LytS [Ruminiclostridium papyrosolvens DSM 2782]|uniref:histidine kinase n=1 Tax=Ruminiclostridium papyrosolvens DSM 2782 TaxID=588581 RepID=F1TF12_9FIRM|nr:histidine kinase [Ruminiclostridium papyrosolvens]EGD46950.1 signal transduction histidine kinase, LytS [Ruminiclostridium papyrosolvens DSM 2782]WES33802.1 histidine kinase [Ruminiclostridium papyrosolvens DSM 2782]